MSRIRLAIVAVAVLAAALGFALYAVPEATAEGTFLSAPGRNAVVVDDHRGLLYVTNDDSVLRYDYVRKTFLRPFVVGGTLVGMDISPDGQTLAVADAEWQGDADLGTNCVHLIDLDTGVDDVLEFALEPGEGGTWRTVFGADGSLFVSSRAAGASLLPLKRVDFESGEIEVLAWVAPDAALATSADRNVVGITCWTATGPWAYYTVSTGVLTTGGTSGHQNFDMAVNEDGTQFAFPVDRLRVFTASLVQTASLDPPLGACYGPASGTLWAAGNGTRFVTGYDSRNFGVVRVLDFEQPFTATTASVMGWTVIATSKDESVLAATSAGGARFVRLMPAIAGQVLSSNEAAPLSGAQVEVYRQKAGTWEREATVTAGINGTWSYPTTDTSPVRVRMSDPAGMHDPAWLGGSDVADAQDLTATVDPAPAVGTLALVKTGSLRGSVTDAETDAPLAGVEVRLWRSDVAVPTVLSAVTGAGGTYEFAAVPPGAYLMSFGQTGVAYDQVFSGGAYTVDRAAMVCVDGAGVHVEDCYLPRHLTVAELSPAAVASGGTARAGLGQPVTLVTRYTDAGLAGAPRDGMKVVLESSSDAVDWTEVPTTVTGVGGGNYQAAVSSGVNADVHYRFVAPDDEYVLGTASDEVLVTWRGLRYFEDTVASDDTVYPGEVTRVSTRLYRQDGLYVPGHTVVLESSVDGVHFVPTGIAASNGWSGSYTADLSFERTTWVRFVALGDGTWPWAASEPILIGASSSPGLFKSVTATPANAALRYQGSVLLTGELSQFSTAMNGRMQVQRSLDGITWSSVSASPVTFEIPSGGSPRVVATVTGITQRARYRFALVSAAGTAKPSASSAVDVIPGAWVSTPKLNKKARRNAKVTVTGVALPGVSGEPGVQLIIKRKSGKKWVRSSTLWVRPAPGATVYATKIKFKKAGTYRVYASMPATANHGASPTSGYRQIVVK